MSKNPFPSQPLIIHVPHSSEVIPSVIRNQFVLSDKELNFELNRMTDAFTDDLFCTGLNDKYKVIFPISRLVVDPERFIDDDMEPMAQKGLGVVYTHTSEGKRLRLSLDQNERESLINKYYKPHHKMMAQLIDDQITIYDKCLIIDCHSFPSKPLTFEENQSTDRPDICVGTDDYHTPLLLVDLCSNLFKENGYITDINLPFSGSFVPGRFYHMNRKVKSIMIEINRKLYMDETSGKKNDNYQNIKSDLFSILSQISFE